MLCDVLDSPQHEGKIQFQPDDPEQPICDSDQKEENLLRSQRSFLYIYI